MPRTADARGYALTHAWTHADMRGYALTHADMRGYALTHADMR
jgi:hypothetical protein